MKSRRREFLAAVAVSTVACGGHPSPWRFLTQEEADTLAAVCSRIIPTDRDAGAAEAGVVDFIDRQLAGFYKAHRKTYREGLAGIDQMGGASFVKLDAAQQTAVLKALEKKHSSFFDLVVTHTMQGYYGSPRHGGNRDAVSWRMLGVPYPPVRGRA
jgi:gluconate 2-dehydrogenase gamma chain